MKKEDNEENTNPTEHTCNCKHTNQKIEEKLEQISKLISINHDELLSIYGAVYDISHYLQEEVIPRLEKNNLDNQKDKYIMERLHKLEEFKRETERDYYLSSQPLNKQNK